MRITEFGWRAVAGCAMVVAVCFSSEAADIDYLPHPGKVAFIGNSLTMNNCGTDNVVKGLGDAMAAPLSLTINQQIQTGGCYLSCQWTPTKIAVVQTGGFDMVVMQEGGDLTYSTSPTDAAQFFQYAKMWADTIRATGATPVLYMMWAWRDDSGATLRNMTNHQAAEYDSTARLIHAKVIPIGRGYYKLRTDTSAIAGGINLFVDYQHPTACATYFIGCIAFSALYNISPVGNSYIGASICGGGTLPTAQQAAYLQQVAWDTWLQYGGADSGRGYVPSTSLRDDHAPRTIRTREVQAMLVAQPDRVATPGALYTINGARVTPLIVGTRPGAVVTRGMYVVPATGAPK
jgi:hypothetical protein